MSSQGDVLTRLRELGIYNLFYYRMELKPLSQLLNFEETLNCVLTGVCDGRRRMVAITDCRILIIAAGAIGDGEVTVIKRESVKSFEFNKKILLSSATIKTGERTFIFKQTQAALQELFLDAMKKPVKEFKA